MPELPEVETVKRGLSKLIIRKQVAKATSDNFKSFPNAPAEVEAFLLGARITAVRRRAKVIVIDLDSGYSLVVHLKMTGQLVYRGEENWGAGHPNDSLIGELPDKTTHAEIEFADGSKLFFNDQRKFGWVKLLATPLVEELPFFQTVGPEPLTDDFTAEVLERRLARRAKSRIKAALLDQTTVAGLGNIYVDESLFLSRIHPETLVGDLQPKQFAILTKNIKQVLQQSIDAGGSSSRNYVDADGKRGNYLDGAYVYGRAGLPCRVCGAPIIKLKVAGRGTHICPVCQPAPTGYLAPQVRSKLAKTITNPAKSTTSTAKTRQQG